MHKLNHDTCVRDVSHYSPLYQNDASFKLLNYHEKKTITLTPLYLNVSLTCLESSSFVSEVKHNKFG